MLDELLDSLRNFVSFRTVSSKPQYAEDCRRGASWLRSAFKRFGATTEMLNTDGGCNPIVFARFKGTSSIGKKILFYGHYDVIAAENDQAKWIVDPFDMQGRNGYLYGRGTSDNKGPILAALYAVADLVSEKKLESEIVFLIEGEEESGSRGFQSTVMRNKHIIGDIDWILLANSYWLNDDIPCLTYGLRGVIHATVEIESAHPDLHSGVDGSHLMDEALKDLVLLISRLSDPEGRILLPGFFETILPISEAEEKRYELISKTLLESNPNLGEAKNLAASLKARWREPTLTIHGFKTSGPANSTIIPRKASAAISMRLVPDQAADDIRKGVIQYLTAQFAAMNTSNKLTITINHEADPWLGDPENKIFQTLEQAIMEAWGPITNKTQLRSLSSNKTTKESVSNNPLSPRLPPTTSSTLTNGSNHTFQATDNHIKLNNDNTHLNPFTKEPRRPLYIREGGSIPAIRFLEKEFNAPAAHLPCGQASDSAHLDNERIRVANLYKSREIFRTVFRELPLK